MKVVAIAVLALLACPSVWAAPTLDQHQETTFGAAIGPYDGVMIGQTFTAGLSGTLALVELGFDTAASSNPTYPSTVEIRTTALGLPTDIVLGSIFMPAGFTPGWNTFDFTSQDIPMAAGTMYSIVVWNNELLGETGSPTNYISFLTDPAGYPNGQLVVRYEGAWSVFEVPGIMPGGDLVFRTYVEAANVVPVPGALLLTVIGSTLATRLRRRNSL